MNLNQLQREQKEWADHNFGERPSWQPLLGAMEELGELAHAHLKMVQNIRMNENHLALARDSVADVIIFLCDYCSSMGFDMDQVLTETWEHVKRRDWKKYPANGIDK